MKIYKFDTIEYSNEPGWEFHLYKSDDVNGSWCSERSCFVAALEDYGAKYDPEELNLFSVYTLEQICLQNDIYVQFIDDQED